jgi:purine nucleoside phosphorylase
MTYYDQVKEAADVIRGRVPDLPGTAIVLGSGLGDFAGSLGNAVSIPYDQLPHWPASRVVGHEGRLVVGTSRGRRRLAAGVRLRGKATSDRDIRVLSLRGKTLIYQRRKG